MATGRVQNPFGAAKPREAVLANKLGLKEEDVLKKEVLKERVKARPCWAFVPSMLTLWLPMLPVLGLPHCELTWCARSCG